MKLLRKANVMFKEDFAGIIEETGQGFCFTYDANYIAKGKPIAVAFPIQKQPYESKILFPFFKGLLPEGWYRDIVCRTLKIDSKDEFGLLIKACGNCIGAVWIKE